MSWVVSIVIMIGSLGYIALLVLGPIAWKAVGGRFPLLPLAFKLLAVIVICAHIQIQYFHYFDLLHSKHSLCEESRIEQCTIAKVTKIETNEYSNSYAIVEFYDRNDRFVKMQVEDTSHYHILPDVGDEVLIRYEFGNNSDIVAYINSKFKRRFGSIDFFLMGLSIFIFIFSIFINAMIQKKVRRLVSVS